MDDDLSISRLLYSIFQAADMLSISVPTLRRGIARGDIATTRIGSRRLIHRDEIERIAREGLDVHTPAKARVPTRALDGAFLGEVPLGRGRCGVSVTGSIPCSGQP
jgi:excisionase family DNA binding protein